MALNAQENCNNGIDDDGDGLIDLNDPECICSFIPVVSIIPNPSFENYSECPDDSAELDFATPWIQATNATTDFFNCGFVYPSMTDIGLDVFPDGTGAVGAAYLLGWKEYIGTPLLSPMPAGVSQQLTFHASAITVNNDGETWGPGASVLEPVNITLYGCANGTNLPLNTTNSPSAFDLTWVVIGQITYVPQSVWQEITINFTPTFNVNAIMLGAPTILPPTFMNINYYPFILYDNLILNEAEVFGVNISQSGSFCDNNLILTANITDTELTNPTYQWYKEGVAIMGAVNATYNVPTGEENLGTYRVKVSDTDGCFISSAIIINNVLAIPEVTLTQPTCTLLTGSINVSTPGIAYSIDAGVTWQSSPTFTNLPVGTYFIKVKTGIGCISATKTVTLAYPPSSITPIFTANNINCGQGGTITITTVGSAYSFDGGQTWTNNPVATDLPVGSYLLAIRDVNGCVSNTVTAQLYEVFFGYPEITIVQPTCGVNGSITVTSTATAYSFDDGMTWTTNPVASDLPMGSYAVITKDADGCLSNPVFANLVEILLPAPEFTFVLPSCGTLGSISITTPAEEYSFDNGVTWTTNPVATDLPGGDYYIVVKKSGGCLSDPAFVDLNENFITVPEFTFINPVCPLLGSISITTIAAFYSFDGGITWTTTPTLTDLNAGSYTIKIKNSDGCESAPIVVNLVAITPSPPQYTLIQPDCPTESGTGITLTINSPGPEYSFDNGATWTTNPVKTNLIAGIYYYIKIKNANGCISKTSYVFSGAQNAPPPAPSFSVIHPADCTNPTGTISVTTTGVEYSFDNGTTWVTNNSVSNLPSGTYNIKVRIVNGGCPSYPAIVTINPPPQAPDAPLITINQPTSCATPFGSITVTSPAYLYSFDNGATYTTNPAATTLTPATYEVRVKNIFNCESIAVTAVLIPPTDYPNSPTLTLTQPDCTNPNGTIIVDSLAAEYSFNDGVTWITTPIMSNLVPGTYSVKIKNGVGCVSEATTAVLIPFTDFTPLPTASAQTFCIQDNATLADVIVNGQDIKWYDTSTGGNLLPITTVLTNSIFYASQTIDGCESERIAVPISLQNTPAPTGLSPQKFCASQLATLNNLIVNGNAIQFYDSLNNGILLPASTLLQNGVTYYATQTLNGCESLQRLGINVIIINSLPATDFENLVCDDLNDGVESTDLTIYEEDIIVNSTTYTFAYYTSLSGAENELASALINNEENYTLSLGQNTIYIRVVFNNLCYKIVELKLTLLPSPFLNMKDSYSVCENGFTNITADPGFDSYTWSTGATTPTITVTEAGNYSVNVTKNHGTLICSSTKNITVDLSNKATITTIETVDWTAYDNMITIIVSGLGEYEYSLDGIHFQSSNQFFGLPNGEYTIYVNDINGCGIAKEDIYLLMYPKFFTPNGDSYNDVWYIKFHENETNLKVHIFDRYGKFLKQLTLQDAFWDGTYNGETMPSTDYWFVVIRENGKEHRGHFTLKR